MKETRIDEELWEVRDLLHRAVQMHIAGQEEEAQTATKDAYRRLATVLDRMQSNLKRPVAANNAQPAVDS
ncbi:hypothetical protein JNB88_31435 [Rhizobium cauense]|uniref:hypothetical protein n=1 Tax=Rhizobium cauense TaxID=1166683 RepID=UPI001C6DE626|nr:hypothetical protein [Rhizobium cauense]MBW9118129.1 hypothetical protein [Rhizobium cauense]